MQIYQESELINSKYKAFQTSKVHVILVFVNQAKPKYEFITSHTTRQSGATNMYLAGFDLKFIQDILSSKVKQTISYIKVSAENSVKQLINHSYLSGK